MTKIYLIKNLISGGVRFDLKAEGLPANFLGLAADLKFRSEPGKVAFERMDWGPVIGGLTNLPIKMANFQQGKLVMGMTFRSTDLPKLKDGVLASFYFKGQGTEFEGFERTILSKFEGKRVDLADTEWLVAEKTPLKTLPMAEKVKAAEIPAEQLPESIEPWQEIVSKSTETGLDQKAEWWGDLLWFGVVVILVLISLIFGLTIGKLRLKSRG